MKILVIAMQGIGDIIMQLPMLIKLKEEYHGARITLLSNNGFGEFLLDNEIIDEITTVNLNYIDVIKSLIILRKYKFDIIIVPFPGGIRSNILSWLIYAPKRVGFVYTTTKLDGLFVNVPLPVLNSIHDAIQNLQILKKLNVGHPTTDGGLPALPEVSINKSFFYMLEQILTDEQLVSGKYVALHPGSSRTMWYKRWDRDNYVKLGNMITSQYNYKIILLGDAEESELCDYISSKMTAECINLAGKLNMLSTIALINKCAIVIGSDSSIIHIAALLNTPTIGIFGPTSPTRSRPLGKAVKIVSPGIRCSPCYFRAKKFECKNDIQLECLKLVTPEIVLASMEELCSA